MKVLSFTFLILGLLFSLSSCQRKNVTYNSKGEPIYTDYDVNAKKNDSTEIYGKGYFDYRDTIESFHMGYSIPRDSVYKVENLKAFLWNLDHILTGEIIIKIFRCTVKQSMTIINIFR